LKKLIILIIIAMSVVQMAIADGQDTLWFRTAGAGVQELDFTPDDKYVIAWTPSIEFWEVEEGVKEFYIPSEVTGDFNYDQEYLVFVQDSTPKLLNWQTKAVVDGFEKVDFKIERIKTAKSRNEFLSKNKDEDRKKDDEKFYFWDIDSKSIVDSFDVVDLVDSQGLTWVRSVLDYGYIGNNDEYFYIKYSDYNGSITPIPPSNRRTNDFYHIYDRETKELKDSIFRYQSTVEDNGIYVDKLFVMSDRSKVAWNDEGGVINFYQFDGEKFNLFDKLVFSDSEFGEVNDIDFIISDNIIGIASSASFKAINLINKELLQEYKFEVGNISFPSNSNFFSISGGSFVTLRKKVWLISNINMEDTATNLLIAPNPAQNTISISYNFNTTTEFTIKLFNLTGSELTIIDQGISNDLNSSFDYNVSHLPSGTYFIELEYDGTTITNQFIKE
jgi:hypothetical protein